MNKLLKYVPLHLLLCLTLGILSQYYYKIWVFGFLPIFLLLSVLGIILLFITHRKVFTLLTFLLFFILGVSAVFVNNSKNYNNNYELFSSTNSRVTLRIVSVLKPSLYHKKYIAEVIQVRQTKTRGRILLNLEKDSTQSLLHVDDVIVATQNFSKLRPPLNPKQFNYKKYLAKQGIYEQVFITSKQYIAQEKQFTSLVGVSEKVRNNIQKALKRYHFKNDEFAVINALLLGQRQDVSKGLLADYANAGAIHILAVSGLHVGIVLLILSILLKPLLLLRKGKYIKVVILILLLWMFAFIAGLSASVVRAVTMFTFVAFGQIFLRKNNVFFSLISSLLLLLICKPMFLFDVGFQLSYLAVFGIVWVQPKLYKVYKPKFYVDKKIWELITVSIGAQIGILPLSIYYFQQFPGLFILANLVIIPFLGAILIGGILIIGLALLNILPQFLASIYANVISVMNAFVSWISKQESFLFKELTLSLVMMLACYFFIFSVVYFLMKRKSNRFIVVLVSILILQGLYLLEQKKAKETNAFIVFHKTRNSIIGKRFAKNLYVQHQLDSINSNDIYALKQYRIKENLNVFTTHFNNSIRLKEKHILVVDSLGVYNIDGMQNPIVVLQYAPKINLQRLIKKIKPSVIIADGSNFKSYVNGWERICLRNKIPFHYTGQKGAFVLKD
ncbi:ComEC/Rec2 family competence protein [uncultured Polaribacter sp.]|uniref:ComEC/Rec2 family competence protein n=1 Tax=uncultured Polaribacter sp. TaxID=174711 RepID=UPI0026133E24|nr:ComEC/Rec2 family competence protein [uncultured Polaribacter sp.]